MMEAMNAIQPKMMNPWEVCPKGANRKRRLKAMAPRLPPAPTSPETAPTASGHT